MSSGADPRLLFFCVEAEVEMPDEPVPHGCPKFEGGAQKCPKHSSCDRIPSICLLWQNRVPRCVIHQPTTNHGHKVKAQQDKCNYGHLHKGDWDV